jgi:hypothetical protein
MRGATLLTCPVRWSKRSTQTFTITLTGSCLRIWASSSRCLNPVSRANTEDVGTLSVA